MRCPAPLRAVRRRGTAGAVTAELAVLLPALVLLTTLCLAAVGAVALHVQCLDSARTAARALARGEPADSVVVAARSRSPDGAQVRLRRLGDGLVAVEVTATARLPGGVGGVTVGGEAVAASEEVP